MADAYLVKFTESRELVGLFIADNLKDLFWRIDECTNPYDCEYVKLGSGDGIMFTLGGEGTVREYSEQLDCYVDNDGGEHSDIVDMAPAEWCGSTRSRLCDLEKQDWKPITRKHCPYRNEEN